jgi:hypothetical protein
MSEMSNYLEDELVKHIFRTGSFTKPTVLAIALLTTGAIDSDTGQFTAGTGVEVTNAGAYARVDRPPLDANWAATSGGNGLTSNVAAITFTQATANWGTVQAAAICDNVSHNAGNMLFYSPVNISRTIDTGDTAEIAIGALTVTFA